MRGQTFFKHFGVTQGCGSHQSGASHRQLHLALPVLCSMAAILRICSASTFESSASSAQLLKDPKVRTVFRTVFRFFRFTSFPPLRSPLRCLPLQVLLSCRQGSFRQWNMVKPTTFFIGGKQRACETVKLGNLGWDIYTPT